MNFKALVAMLAAAALVCAFALAGCKKQGVGDISKALADDLTDNLTFTNGQKVSGTPPAESFDTAYPQVISVDGPSTLSSS
jgi:outer membrane protein assembly factor BamE (lipoprotein component of BamABCDE complex)